MIPWKQEWQSAPEFLPGEFHGQRSLAGYGSWGHKGLDTTEWLTLSPSWKPFQLLECTISKSLLLLLSLLCSPLFFLILWFYSHSTKCIVDIKYKFPINKCCITWSAVTAHIYWAFTICQLWAKLLQCIISPSLPSCHVRSLGELGLGWGKQDTQGMRLRGAHSQRLTSAASTPENPSVFPALVITIISIFILTSKEMRLTEGRLLAQDLKLK